MQIRQRPDPAAIGRKHLDLIGVSVCALVAEAIANQDRRALDGSKEIAKKPRIVRFWNPIDCTAVCRDIVQPTRIASIRRPVADISPQIRIARREADGVDLQPAAEPGGVFAGAVVLQQRIVVEFAGGEGEAAAVRGGGFRSDISVGVVVDRVEHHARVIDDAADGAEVIRQQPAEVAGVGAGDEIVDRIRPEVASCQRAAGVQVGIDLEAGEIVAGFIGIPTVYGELLSRRGRAAGVAVRVQNSLDAVTPSVVAVGYTKIDVGAIGFSLDFRQLIVVVVRIEPFFGGARNPRAFDEVAVVVVGVVPEAVGAVLVFAGGAVGAVVRAAGSVHGFAVAVVAVGVGGCPGGRRFRFELVGGIVIVIDLYAVALLPFEAVRVVVLKRELRELARFGIAGDALDDAIGGVVTRRGEGDDRGAGAGPRPVAALVGEELDVVGRRDGPVLIEVEGANVFGIAGRIVERGGECGRFRTARIDAGVAVEIAEHAVDRRHEVGIHRLAVAVDFRVVNRQVKHAAVDGTGDDTAAAE